MIKISNFLCVLDTGANNLIGFSFLAAILFFCVCTTLLKLSRLAFNGFRFSGFESSRNDQKLYIICKTTCLNVISPWLIMTVQFFAARSNHMPLCGASYVYRDVPLGKQFIYHTVVIHVYTFSNYVSVFLTAIDSSSAHPLSSLVIKWADPWTFCWVYKLPLIGTLQFKHSFCWRILLEEIKP